MVNKKFAMAVTSIFILISMVYSIITCQQNDVMFNDNNWDSHYYCDFISRACVYMFGCLMAQISLKPIKSKITWGNRPNNNNNIKKEANLDQDQKNNLSSTLKEEPKKNANKYIYLFAIISILLIAIDSFILHYYFNKFVDQSNVSS